MPVNVNNIIQADISDGLTLVLENMSELKIHGATQDEEQGVVVNISFCASPTEKPWRMDVESIDELIEVLSELKDEMTRV